MLPRLIIDMRCLQLPDYATRGIGTHARGLISHAPEPFIGLIDPNLPALPAALAALAAQLSPHAYLPGLPTDTVFLNPSPMGPAQNFVARLLLNPAITKAACVHDFIPFDAPETHLLRRAHGLEYFTAMAWLRRYDQFFPVSQPTATRLGELYGPVPAHVTGAPLPGWAERVTPGPGRHILMIGGSDPRKNPEVLLAARNANDILRAIPVVITGEYPLEDKIRLQNAGATLPGTVDEPTLQHLYAHAVCVVVPSRAEGFSLPVVEAMAAQTPAVVSDIPAHRALVADASLRFPPDDAPALAAILEPILTQPGHRERLIAAQSGLWRGFTADAVAKKIFGQLYPATPAITRGAKPRVAMLTPLPPAKSGVADYSAAMAPELARLCELSLFGGPQISALPHLSRAYDSVLSVIGNSPHHSVIQQLAITHGSAALCHDSRLLGLAAWHGPGHAAAMASAELGRPVSHAEIIAWDADETLREADFLQPLAIAARPLIFHAREPVAQVQSRFGVAAAHLPFAIQRPFPAISPAMHRAARHALGLGDKKIIASFGFIGHNKGIPAALHAFAALRAHLPCRLVFVGEPTGATPAYAALATALGIAPFVQFGSHFFTEADYRNHLLAADCALQLRQGTPGNISGALQDCIAAGLPSVANRDLARNIFAPSYIREVGDDLNVDEIANALAEMLDTKDDTEAERATHCETYSMANYAKKLMSLLDF